MARNRNIFDRDLGDFDSGRDDLQYGENWNGFRSSTEVFLDPIGGGGGGGGRGGSSTPIIGGCTDPKAKNYNARATKDNGTCLYFEPIEEPIIKVVPGCTDRTALNYNPKATFNNGTCRYRTVEPISTYNNYNAPVRVTVTSNNGAATVFVNGESTSLSTTHVLEFTEKELLTPKLITVKKSGYTSKDEYKISAYKKSYEVPVKKLPIISVSDRPIPTPPRPFIGAGIPEFNDDLGNKQFFGGTGFGEFNTDVFRGGAFEGNINPIRTSGGLGRGFNNLNVRFDEITPQRVSRDLNPTRLTVAPLTKIVNNYYEILVEKKVNGRWVQQNILKPGEITNSLFLKNRVVTINTPFSLKQDSIIKDDEDDVVIDNGGGDVQNERRTTKYSVRIIADVPNDETIQYRTNYGQLGYVLDEDDYVEFTFTQTEGQDSPFIEFFGQGISEYTHKATYEFKNGTNQRTARQIDSKFELLPGGNNFKVTVAKSISVQDSPSTPLLNVNQNSVIFNTAQDNNVTKISYTSSNAEEVIYTLGKVKKSISPNGTIKLTKNDFTNGLGRYTLYLQPVSARGGSGDVQKVVITVESKAYLPGPDITTINYPQNIQGADFKGTDVDFQVSWQSINTNYIRIYVGKYSNDYNLGQFPAIGTTSFNVGSLIRKGGNQIFSNRDVSQITLLLVPFNEEGDELTEGKVEEINITFDKGDLTLRRAEVVSDIKSAFSRQFNESTFNEYISPFLTHYLHLGDGDNKLIATWGIDEDTLSEFEIDETTNRQKLIKKEKALVLKLYEPLPRNIGTNDTIWISKIQSIPLIDQITILDDIVNACTPLTPNFNLEVNDDVGYQILDDLIASGSTSSTEVVNQFISSSNFSLENLNINFVTQSTIESGSILISAGDEDYNWKDFIKYSSAAERVENFYYKVKLIESYEGQYELLTSGSAGSNWTGSLAVVNDANKKLEKINDVKKGFDAFEKFLYTSSSIGGLTYPGAGQTELSSSTDSSVTNWYAGILSSAVEYDNYNTSRLTYNLPKHITNDENNSEFILFFDMVGQHFDILWTHIKGISQSKKLENKFENGINNDLIYHMLESLGWNADMGVKSQFLWEYAFGKHSDGTQISSMSGKERQQEVWRRLLNNLPYLYKHKGTKRAVHAALSCYGIPASLLTVMEFGGPQDPTTAGTTNFTYEDRTASINISGSASIIVPWKEYSETSDHPNSVEIRLNTDQRQDQQVISGSEWSLHLLKDTGSMAHFELRVSGSGTLYSASTDSGSFFNDEYTQVVVNKTTTGGDDVFTFYAKEGFQERLRTNVSGSLTISGVSGWTSGSNIEIGGSTLTASVDEFRLWTTALSESRVDNHTLLPDAIDGNHISSSTEDLIFRLDFEYPKNRSTSGDPYIKNVSINRFYGESYATASMFVDDTTYPYQYTPYDRTVTANVPSSGFNVGNKVRFESQTKISDLSYRQRATKKSLDQSPIDTDRLGLFFSPVKEINMDILKSLGSFSIDNYIGNPSDEYSDEYRELRSLRNYYFDRYSLNFNEYIQLVRYIDKSLFDTLESLVPARAKVSSGLLIEPHILERSKTKWNKPTSEKGDYSVAINVDEDINAIASNEGLLTIIDASNDTILTGDNSQYQSTIDAEADINLTATNDNYSSTIIANDDINLVGTITRNSGSTMGGIEVTIDAEFTGSLQGQYESTEVFTQIGMEPDSISRLGFGVYGKNGNSVRTRLDKDNNYIKERVKIYLLKQSYTEDVPQNISVDASQGREFVTQTKYRYKVNILPFTGSNGLETQAPSGGDIVSATPLDGYFPLHYRNVGDLTTGLENSFFNGSKQTSATTLDGGSPVQIFTTNPNTLRVSDSGRGSGEPILEVD